MGSSNRAGTRKTPSSCLCGSGSRYGMVEGRSGSILGKRMMQGEATIESFESYPRQGPSTSTTSSSRSSLAPIGSKQGIYQRSDWLEGMLGEREADGSSREGESRVKRSYQIR